MKINEFDIKGYDKQVLTEALDSLGIENESELLDLARSIWRAVSHKHNEISDDNLAKLVQIYDEAGVMFYPTKKHRHFHVTVNVYTDFGKNMIGDMIASTSGEDLSLVSCRKDIASKAGLNPHDISILSWQEMSDGQFIEEMKFQKENPILKDNVLPTIFNHEYL